eukprot:gene18469-biopygen885
MRRRRGRKEQGNVQAIRQLLISVPSARMWRGMPSPYKRYTAGSKIGPVGAGGPGRPTGRTRWRGGGTSPPPVQCARA